MSLTDAPPEATTGLEAAPQRGLVVAGTTIAWSTLALAGVIAALLIAAGITTSSFFTADNFRAILGAAALTGIAAIGLTFVTLSGNFVSLSVGQTAVACAIALALALHHGWGLVLALLVTLALAVVIGVIQGGVVGAGANPIIVTLGVGAGLQGLASIVSDGKEVRTNTGSLDWLGDTRPLGIPMSTYVFIVLAIVATIFLVRHRSGQKLALAGENRNTATATGYSTMRIAMLAFVLSSIGAAIVAVLSVSAFQRASVDSFGNLTFDAIAAVLVGGTAIGGGIGSPARTALGAIFIAILANFMLLRDWPFGVRLTVQGAVVVIAVSVYHLIQTRRAA